MGLLERMHQVANSTMGAGKAVLGIVTDLARAPFTDDEFKGVAGTLYGSTMKHGNALLAQPGQAPLLPENILAPVRNVGKGAMAGLEFAYREGISEPLSTLSTVGSIGASTDNQYAFTDPTVWRKAYRIAQNRSPGQALALGIGKVDIYDESELASYIGSDAYKWWSGSADFLLRVSADPTVLVGKGLKAARTKFITQPLHSPADVLAAIESPRFNTWLDDIDEVRKSSPDTAAALIRDRYFPDHENGAYISSILSQTRSRQELQLSARALLGDPTAYKWLESGRSAIAGPIASLNKRVEDLAPIRAAEPYKYQGTVIPPDAPNLFAADMVPGAGYDDVLRQSLIQDLDKYDALDARLSRTQSAFQSLTEVPRSRAIKGVPAFGEVRTRITRSDFYQTDPLSRPLHRIFDMTPQSMILASGKTGDVQLSRMMVISGVDINRRNILRTNYLNATDNATRVQIAQQIENEAIANIAKSAGMSFEEIDDLVMKISGSRDKAMHALARREMDPSGKSTKVLFEGEDGFTVERHFPSWITQDETLVPLVDINKVKHVASRIGSIRAHNPASKIPPEMLEMFYRLWKPAVLIRPAWAVRVVGDEQGRILAKVGALTHLDNLQSGMRNYTTDYVASVKDRGFMSTRGSSNKPLREGFGVRGFQYRGYDGEGAFGTPDDIRRHVKQTISSANQYANVTGNRASVILREWRELGENYRSVLPDDDDYASAYEWGASRLHENPIARQLLSGKSEDDVVAWLQSTPEGSDILRAHTVKGYNARNWVKTVNGDINAFVAGSDELFDLMRQGKLTHADLARVVPETSEQPFVHGESLRQDLGEGYTSKLIESMTKRAFAMFGKTPTDVMSRNRFFDEMFQAEVKRRVDLLDGDVLDPKMQDIIRDGAREYATTQTTKLLYDLAEESQFGHMLKFLSPFYNAWQEVFTRWAGLAIENPPFIMRARMAFRAPDKAGLVTDEDGRVVEWDKEYSDIPGDPNFRGKDRFITLPLPEWLKSIPGMEGIASKGSVAFNKKSFSMIMALPGFGPPVQLAVNQLVKDRPDLADSVKFILPIGPTQDPKSLLLPAAMKRGLSVATEDQQYLNDKIRILMDKVTDIQLGKRDFDLKDPEAGLKLYAEATAEAKAFYMLRLGSALTLPAAASYRSPYQMYIEALNQARARHTADPNSLMDKDGNARTPDEWFVDEYGKEYFFLTQAVSKSMDGIPATLQAWEKRKEYKDLVERYADLGLGGFIIGKDDTGEFNNAVYQLQKNSELRPGSDKNQREPISFEEALQDPNRRLGWMEYRKAMDLIEATRIQRGLPNLQVAAARDLAAAKSAVSEYLANKYPAWFDDFNQTDKGKWDKKIAAMQDVAARPEMAGRPDMKGVRDYMIARNEFTKVLAQRKKAGGASTLTASSNADLAQAWNVVTGYLIESNLAFSSVFYRHLENDPLGL